jgi:hypothetical protein
MKIHYGFGMVVWLAGCFAPPGDDGDAVAAGPPQERIVVPPGPPASPCAPTTVTPIVTPPRWDMQGVFSGYGQNLMTPVDDQLQRGSCWVFAQISQLEMEYVRQYSLSHTADQTSAYASKLQLSKQYYIEMTAIENTGPAFSEYAGTPPAPIPAATSSPLIPVGDLTDLNQTCGGTPLIGVPRTAAWPYVYRSAGTEYSMMQAMPLAATEPAFIAPDDAQAFYDLLATPSTTLGGDLGNGLSLRMNLDLANFYWDNTGSASPTTSVYPPPSVHEAARYAPMAVRYLATYIDDDEATPAVPLPSACTMAPHQYPIVVPQTPLPLVPRIPTVDQIACYNALAAPFETLLSQNHPIVVTTRPNDWARYSFPIKTDAAGLAIAPGAQYWNAYNPAQWYTTVLGFTNPTTAADQHFVTLIGYDHDRQLFHFKNEWGTDKGTGQGAGNDGTFWMTYDLLFRTMFAEPEYIDGVWDPTNALAGTGTSPYPEPQPIPNGNWYGFWQGSIGGVGGVAVIGEFPNDTRVANPANGQNQGQIGNPTGEFFFSDGSAPLKFQMTEWESDATTYTAYFGDRTTAATPLFTLTATYGSAQPTATWTSASAGLPAQWSKCGGEITGTVLGEFVGTLTVEPQSWLDILNDPYVLPPCNTPTWHVAPTWTCNAGDGKPVNFVAYKTGWGTTSWKASAQPGEDEVTRLCLTPSTAAPSCPAGSTLKSDLNWIAETYASADNPLTGDAPQTLDACVLTSDATCLACDSTTTDCIDEGACSWLYQPPTCPTPSGLTSSSYLPWLGSASWTATSFAPALWLQVKAGADTCVSAAYPPTATCPSGYELSPNGNDCLVFVRPPPPPPPGGGSGSPI